MSAKPTQKVIGNFSIAGVENANPPAPDLVFIKLYAATVLIRKLPTRYIRQALRAVLIYVDMIILYVIK